MSNGPCKRIAGCAALALLLTVGCDDKNYLAPDDAGRSGSKDRSKRDGSANDAASDQEQGDTNVPVGDGGNGNDVSAGDMRAVKIAADEFLALIDDRDLQGAYELSAEFVKQEVPAEDFAQMVSAALDMAGTASSRTFVSSSFVTDPQGEALPRGDYASVDYQTEFSLGGTLFEQVVMYREAGGAWRMIGYTISATLPMPIDAIAFVRVPSFVNSKIN
jgi:hypothetical protein